MKNAYNIGLIILIAYLIFCSFSLSDIAPKVIVHQNAPVSTNSKDVDVMAYLQELGVKVKVDEEALVEKYGLVDLSVEAKEVTLRFPNPTEHRFTLDIYDKAGNPVISLMDIYNDEVQVDTKYLNENEYLYKLSGDGNLYAGKFSLAISN